MPMQTMQPDYCQRDSQAVVALYAFEIFIVVAIVDAFLIALATPRVSDLVLLYQAVS